jgi:hypothetical protein
MSLSGARRVLVSCAAVGLAGFLVSATSAHAGEKTANAEVPAASAAAAFESCYTYRAELLPESQGPLPPAADNNADMVTNMSFGDEWCPNDETLTNPVVSFRPFAREQ